MTKARNSNFELLRIISMIMILGLHFLLGGGLENLSPTSNNYEIAWLLESICYSSVNCYILMSGYYLYGRTNINIKKIVNIIIQVLFYSVGIYLVFCSSGYEAFNIKTLITGYLFPVTHGSYWYATVYIVSLIAVPYINLIIDSLDKKRHLRLLIEFGVVFSIIPIIIFFSGNTIGLSGGYSLIWFIYLYFVAGYIRKYDITLSSLKCSIGFIVFSIMPFLVKICQQLIFHTEYWNLYKYNSFSVFGSALCLFLLIKNMKPRSNKFVNLIGSTTFGVFLIHTHYIMRDKFLWHELIKPYEYLQKNATDFIIGFFINIIAVFIICSIIDLIRIAIFKGLGVLFDKIRQKSKKEVS